MAAPKAIYASPALTFSDAVAAISGQGSRGGWYNGLCPAHKDSTPSLGIKERPDGTFAVKCQAGCSRRRVIEALEEKTGKRNGARSENKRPQPAGLTLARYAEMKQLPQLFLGILYRTVQTTHNGLPAVQFPYCDEKEVCHGVKLRLSESSHDACWQNYTGPLLFGLDVLTVLQRDTKWDLSRIVLCEGESDTQTLVFHGIPALGVSGKQGWKPEFANLTILKNAKEIFVIQEPDAKDFADEVVKSFPTGKAHRMVLPAKDPSELWVKSTPQEFDVAWAKAIEGAYDTSIPFTDTGNAERLVKTHGQTVIETVVSKYCNHTPLHRQSMILERDLGLEISRATLDGWVLVGELLVPMVAAMRRELISGSYIQADETPVDVQTREGRGKNHQAYLWQYGRPGGTVVFDFRLGRGRDGPKRFLGHFQGILQTDGYAAYDQIGWPGMVHAACWAHARRQFFEAVQLNPRDSVATPIVARMGELFAVDAEARRKTLTTAARHIRRQETARPLLDDIRSKIVAAQSAALPSSALSKACQYALALWKKLTRFLEYPELELSTNLAENSMRPVALGRKNWLHIGSPQAGPKVAAILSVVESCRRLKLPVRDYFAAVLPGLADLPIRRLPDLTPATWVARHS